ncbi:HAD family hydrolase [Aestuariivirga sp.]|uniref:HAD family hydrolase n=1 Tax=Aestuariivirga sp. TaxID=2650926 RepID=UPI0039E3ECCC
MRFDAAVFDFDGTLVDSAGAKRDSFFAIFPDDAAHRAIVGNVLLEDPDGSRHRVIPEMARRMRDEKIGTGGFSDDALVARYGEVSAAAVAAAPELPGASRLLEALSKQIPLHLCSNTPEDAVRAQIARRGWRAFFKSVDGYPTEKTAKVAEIIRDGRHDPARVVVVGDGISDELAASANAAIFIPIRAPEDLETAGRIIAGERHV